MAKATVTTTSVAAFVQIQTLRGTQGHAAALATVQAAVDAFNKAQPKGATPHIVHAVRALPNNTKGMQFQLALLATLARQHGCTLVRLSVHNGEVALCGPKASVEAAHNALVPAYNALSTAVASAFDAGKHGNRVGFTNGWLCGAPAGLQVALGIAPTLAYGVGFLFTFPAPGDGKAYALGQAYGVANAATVVGKPTTKPAKPARKPAAKPAVSATTDATTEATTDATTDDAAAAA